MVEVQNGGEEKYLSVRQTAGANQICEGVSGLGRQQKQAERQRQPSGQATRRPAWGGCDGGRRRRDERGCASGLQFRVHA